MNMVEYKDTTEALLTEYFNFRWGMSRLRPLAASTSFKISWNEPTPVRMIETPWLTPRRQDRAVGTPRGRASRAARVGRDFDRRVGSRCAQEPKVKTRPDLDWRAGTLYAPDLRVKTRCIRGMKVGSQCSRGNLVRIQCDRKG